MLGDVAGLAVETAMGTGQRVARLRVVIKAPAFPTIRIVTRPAVWPQAPLMMLIAVAGVAVQQRAFEHQRAMALLASDHGMASNQRKSSDVVVEGRYTTPTGLSVALLAATAKAAVMPIILLVARHASGCQFVAIEVSCVAGIAFDLRMRASQWKFRRLVMVEMNRFPLCRRVAAFALCAVSSGVNVLNPMTVGAHGAEVLVALANMASGAGHGLVCALEWKPGRAVVEWLDLAPSRFAMATVAFFAKAPLVRIVRLMTVEAASGRLAEFCRRRVTAAARNRLVRVSELEIRRCMIECLAVQLDDVGASSLVIGMTMVAILLCGVRLTPMKTRARRTIGSDFLVTPKAEPRLGLSRERLVTVAALLLELGMPLDDRPRRHQLFEQILRLRSRC
jgi:hypothetical protein